jgi:glucose/arabinose dehydrogenase
MAVSKRSYLVWGIGAIAATAAVMGSGPERKKQTLAPHELTTGDAPTPIIRETPALPNGGMNFDTAEEPHLRVVVVTQRLQQPWSLAFLPDGSMFVTERSGRLRIVRDGKLVRTPVAGVPPVQTGGPRGLQGLMDVALHPQFKDNKWVYLAYHRPTAGGEGETVLARGTWNGTALIDVRDIFESGAVDTEASRITFGRDGMLYMSISAPGSPKVQRSQDPNDYAGKTVRLRDDGTIPVDNPFVGDAITGAPRFPSIHLRRAWKTPSSCGCRRSESRA